MALALVPHVPGAGVSPSDRLHLWVGVTGSAVPPALQWRIDGQAATPAPVDPARPGLRPVLTGGQAAKAAVTVHHGHYAFTHLAPGKTVEISVTAGSETIVRKLRPLPAVIPDEPQQRFTVLLTSCFHQLEDLTGTAGSVLSGLKVTPDLSIFAGDQVYLDLPTLKDFKDDEAWLANQFQNAYVTNWFGNTQGVPGNAVPTGFPQLLALAPAMFMPDDHEFWNNYPFWSVQIGNSISPAGRSRWTRAAEATYQGFQTPGDAALGAARALVVEPLSILMLDTRSQRAKSSRDQAGDLLGPTGGAALAAWVDDLVARANTTGIRYPLLVTGQSLFQPAAGNIAGKFADYEFPDYSADYAFLVEQVERISRAGLPLLLATGDVHWGRVSEALDPVAAAAPVFEVISSPTSLVTTIGVDQAKEVWGAIHAIFGSRNQWPRHNDAQKPPPRFGSANQYQASVRVLGNQRAATMRGNQAVMLRFVRSGGGLDINVNCHPLSGDIGFDTREQWSTTLQLRPPRNI